MEIAAPEGRRVVLWRWIKFNSVGAIGIGVQLAVLTLLAGQIGLNYLVATALAVETAVLHNFLWHERWTWADRFVQGRGGAFKRLVQFNLTTGAVSIVGNLVFMRVFVGTLGVHFLVANLMTIAACSVLNFLVSDKVVFQPSLWDGGNEPDDFREVNGV
jgi:putative flippase GtrA